MAKKKDKITVDLDLPKDDSTITRLYIILFFSIIFGIASGLFWIANSGFVPTQNGEPMFTNLYCGATAQDAVRNIQLGNISKPIKNLIYEANEIMFNLSKIVLTALLGRWGRVEPRNQAWEELRRTGCSGYGYRCLLMYCSLYG